MLSVVVPAYNEEPSLRQLVQEITFICDNLFTKYEVIVVDDGSTDGTWALLRELSFLFPHVRGLRLSRCFGKSSALNAGFRMADGDIIIQMDADLQDDPAEIPRFLEKIKEGFDMVVGYKKVRHDPMARVWGSRSYNAIASFCSGVKLHDHNCGFKAYKAAALRGINLYGEMHRHMPALLAGRGSSVTEIVVNHRPRKFGTSKFGPTRIVKGLLDLLTVVFLLSFRQRPLHFLGSLGLVAFAGGMGGLIYLALIWLFVEPIGNRPLLVYSAAAMLLGFQLFATGILAELVTYYLVRPSDTFSICDHTTTYQKKLGVPAHREDPAVLNR